MAERYTCDLCHGTFENSDGWGPEQRDAEMRKNWGELPEACRASVCDDCFDNAMAWAREKGLVR